MNEAATAVGNRLRVFRDDMSRSDAKKAREIGIYRM